MKNSAIVAGAAWLLAQADASQFVMYTGGEDPLIERSDPVISPGEISQHAHQIYGANKFSPELDYDTMQEADCTTVGDAAGYGNAADLSNYWHPALYAEASDGSGYIKIPVNGHKFYYRDAGVGEKREPFEFPHGFRMVAGDPFIRSPQKEVARQDIVQWICHNTGPSQEGMDGGFPSGVSNCNSYPGFNGNIHFPHCWNGEDFDQADPTAHVTYPEGNIQDGECPSSHPTRLPHIFMETLFDLNAIAGKFKADSFVLAMGDNTGYGFHADFFNGWKDGAIPELFDTCPQGEWGNHDIGTCPSFEKFNTKASDCKLTGSYKEEVESPGSMLPGCNPISDEDPAPFYETSPLGKQSNTCKLLTPGGGSGSGGDDDGEYSSAAPSAPASSSTFAVSYKPSSAAAPSSAAPWSPPEEYGPPNKHVGAEVKYVTEHKTVYETVHQTVTATPYGKRHIHEHAHGHGRRWSH